MACSLFPVSYSDSSQSWASVRSCIQKGVNSAVFRVSYTAPWCCMCSRSKRSSQLASRAPCSHETYFWASVKMRGREEILPPFFRSLSLTFSRSFYHSQIYLCIIRSLGRGCYERTIECVPKAISFSSD